MTTAAAFNGSELVEVSQLSATVRRASTTLSFSAVDNSINDATFGLVSAGFAAGDTVQIVGSALNNFNSVSITNVTSGKMTTSAILSTEAAGAAVTVARWDTRSAPAGSGGSGTVESVTGDGVDNTDPSNPVITASDYTNVTESTTARTLGLTDRRKFIDCTNAAGCAITVPPQSSVTWVDNTTITGVGRLDSCTFIDTGIDIIIPDDRILECTKGSPWALRRLDTDVWLLTGYLLEV